MGNPTQKDNSTYHQKVTLRRKCIDLLEARGVLNPAVMETHGGEGHLFNGCYAHIDEGVVFEKDPMKVRTLAKQRPSWAVYRADCTPAIAAGAGNHLKIDLLDVDPYGSPWDTIEAFFTSSRPFADYMLVAVNDGLRHKLGTGSGWEVHQLEEMVAKYGNDLHPIYLQIAEEMLSKMASHAGYRVTRFNGYYTGHSNAMTHYMAELVRTATVEAS